MLFGSPLRRSCEVELLSTSRQTKQLYTLLPTEGRTSAITATTHPCQNLISLLTVGKKANLRRLKLKKKALEQLNAPVRWKLSTHCMNGHGSVLWQFLVFLLLLVDKCQWIQIHKYEKSGLFYVATWFCHLLESTIWHSDLFCLQISPVYLYIKVLLLIRMETFHGFIVELLPFSATSESHLKKWAEFKFCQADSTFFSTVEII